MGDLTGTWGSGAKLPATRGLKRPLAVEKDDDGVGGRPGARGVGGGGRPMTPRGGRGSGATGDGARAPLGA